MVLKSKIIGGHDAYELFVSLFKVLESDRFKVRSIRNTQRSRCKG